MTFKKPVLIFSEYCDHSQIFIEKLKEKKELFSSFAFICIDPDQNNKRPDIFYQIQQKLDYKITQVPTLITINSEYILSGIEAFKWLEFQTKKQTRNEPLEFNPNEMNSTSDIYSSIDGNIQPKQNFMHFGEAIDKIPTPPEDTYDENSRGIDKEQLMTKKMEEFIQERNKLNPQPKQMESSRINWND